MRRRERSTKRREHQLGRQVDSLELMPEGYKGLAGYFEQEVDGDLTADAAKEWLAARGIEASPEILPSDKTPSRAEELEAVTDLSAAVAAASMEMAPPSVFDKVDERLASSKGAGTLPEVTKMIEAALNEG